CISFKDVLWTSVVSPSRMSCGHQLYLLHGCLVDISCISFKDVLWTSVVSPSRMSCGHQLYLLQGCLVDISCISFKDVLWTSVVSPSRMSCGHQLYLLQGCMNLAMLAGAECLRMRTECTWAQEITDDKHSQFTDCPLTKPEGAAGDEYFNQKTSKIVAPVDDACN
ncbi:hypothetical protein BgiBS90_005632, partial [Biomphalaria glabrata]